MFKNWDWKHTALSLCGLGALISTCLATQAKDGATLPLHLTAGGLTIAAMVFGYISKQIGDDGPPKTPKPPSVAMSALLLVAVVSLLPGCVGGVPTAQTQAVISDSAALSLCVESVVQRDETLAPPAPVAQVLLDEGVTCGPEAAALVTAVGQEVNAANTNAAVASMHASVVARRAAKAGR